MEAQELNQKKIMERYNWIREDQNLSLRKFSDLLGVSKSVTDNIIYQRVDRVSMMYINLLCDKLSVNKNWILHGEGDPYKLTTPEDVAFNRWIDEVALDLNPTSKDLMMKISRLNEADLQLVTHLINRFLDENNKKGS